MEKDIVDGNIGEVGSYDLEFKGGKLQFKVGVGKFGVSSEVVVAIDSKVLVELIKKKIPGQVDDVILDVILAGLNMDV